MSFAPAENVIQKFRAKTKTQLDELLVILNKDLQKVFKVAVSNENIDDQTFVDVLSSLISYSGKTIIGFGELTYISYDSIQAWVVGEEIPAPEMRRKYLELCFAATFAQMPDFALTLALILPEYVSSPGNIHVQELLQQNISQSQIPWTTLLAEMSGYGELPSRARNALEYNNGYSSYDVVLLGELLLQSEAELLRIDNLGQKSLTEIKKWLASSGLSLSPSNWSPEHGYIKVEETDEVKAFLKVSDLRRAFSRQIDLNSKFLNSHPRVLERLKTLSSEVELTVGRLATIPLPQLQEYFEHNQESIRVIEEFLKDKGLRIGMEIPPGVRVQ